MRLGSFRLPPAVSLTFWMLLLLLCLLASVVYGTADIKLRAVYEAFSSFDGSQAHVIVRTLRVPRALIALLVGASLSVAGAIMQALTKNPLASPGILGVNAGAAVMVVVAVFILKVHSLTTYALFAFAGAALAGTAVYGMGSLGRGGMTPLKLTIAGAAMTALLSSITQGALVINERGLDEIRFWLAGSVAGRDLTLVSQVAPYLGVGLLLALLMSRQITTLSLGEDVARGLGQRTGWVKAGAALAVVLLAGGSVAVAGPIGFVGLAVPHIARGVTGTDYRWILPHAAVLGGILLVLADLGARFVIHPQEVPVGVMTAVVGAPFFIYLARRGGKRA